MKKQILAIVAMVMAVFAANAVADQTVTIDFSKMDDPAYRSRFQVKYGYKAQLPTDGSNQWIAGSGDEWVDWPEAISGAGKASTLYKIGGIRYTDTGTDGRPYTVELEFDYSMISIVDDPDADTGNISSNYASYTVAASYPTTVRCLRMYKGVRFRIRTDRNLGTIKKAELTSEGTGFLGNLKIPSIVSVSSFTGITSAGSGATAGTSNTAGSLSTSHLTRVWSKSTTGKATDVIFWVDGTPPTTPAGYDDAVYMTSKIALTFAPVLEPAEPRVEVNGVSYADGDEVPFIGEADITFGLNKIDIPDAATFNFGVEFDNGTVTPTPTKLYGGAEKEATISTSATNLGVNRNYLKGTREYLAVVVTNRSKTALQSVSRLHFRELGEDEVARFASIKALTGDLADASDESGADHHNKVVTFSEPMMIDGVYLTKVGGSEDTYYCYLRDAEGNAIKLVSEGRPFPAGYRRGQMIRAYGFAGVFDYNDRMPRINVYGRGYDYFGLFRTALDPTDEQLLQFADPEASEGAVTAADINKRVIYSGVTVRDRRIVLPDGEVQLYPRLWKNAMGEEIPLDLDQLDGTTRYYIDGFVGQMGPETGLFPTMIRESSGTPVLMAPNRISGAKDLSGFLTVNAISDDVVITVDRTGINYPVSYLATINGKEVDDTSLTQWTIHYDETDGGDYVDADGVRQCELVVWSVINGEKCVEPACVRLVHHEAIVVPSIKAFKEIYFGKENTVPPLEDNVIYRLDPTKKAVIVAKTPYYLYVKGMEAADDSNLGRLLLYNRNGWDINPQVWDDGNRAYRSLVPGDEITGFAIRAYVTETGNLISDCTDYARTVRLAGHDKTYELDSEGNPHPYKDVTVDETAPDPLITEADRMMLYTFRGVAVEHPEGTDIYRLLLDGGQKLEMTDRLFTIRDGWRTAYLEGHKYDITGLVLRNGDNAEVPYAISMTGFSAGDNALPPASIMLEGYAFDGAEPEVQEFPTVGHVVMKLSADADQADRIYYTVDGSDPLQNPDSRRCYNPAAPTPENEADLTLTADRTVVRAYAGRPGANPSAVMTRTFVKQTREMSYILNFIYSAKPELLYHFNGLVRVVGVGPEYMFVRGVAGHYLPIYNPDGWTFGEGDYLNDFVIGARVDADGTVVCAEVTPACKGLFGSAVGEPADAAMRIEAVPDEVTTISMRNIRRLVRMEGVRLAVSDGAWTMTDGDGNVFALRCGAAGPVVGLPDYPSAVDAYVVEGFVMPSDGGEPELWPVSVSAIETTPEVKFSVNGIPAVDAALFDGSAEVRLTCDDPDAEIYYSLDGDKWARYGFPFYVTGASTVHAYAQSPGLAASRRATLRLETAEGERRSGEVYFIVRPDADGGSVTIEICPVVEPDVTYDIRYTVDGTAPNSSSDLYGGPFVQTEDATVTAVLIENGAVAGPACRIHVTVPAALSKVSGLVKFSLSEDADGDIRVEIKPEEAVAGDFEIYYATRSGVTLPEDGTLYTGPFDVAETTVVMAVLVEKGKTAGKACGVTVWVNPKPSGIGSVGADSADAVRVEGSSIIAPEGSEVYDIAGRRMRPDSLRPGIYIVRTPDGKAVKLTINN